MTISDIGKWILEILKKSGVFLISRKYSSLRAMIIFFILISTFVLSLVINLVLDNANEARERYESKELEILNFSIISNDRIENAHNTTARVVIGINTNYPVKVSIILDNLRGKEQRTEEFSNFETNHEIELYFRQDELLRPFKIYGKVTDNLGKEIRLTNIDLIPGEFKNSDMGININ